MQCIIRYPHYVVTLGARNSVWVPYNTVEVTVAANSQLEARASVLDAIDSSIKRGNEKSKSIHILKVDEVF